MRKTAILLALVLLVSAPLSVQAATPRTISVTPNISYSGNTATCTTRIFGNSSSDYLEATIKFWRGNSCIETWEETGYGYISFTGTAPATRGNTYKLTVDFSVNGVEQDSISFSKKYA